MKRLLRFSNNSVTVALPKAIREVMEIQKGDSLEFKINKNGSITIKKA